MLTDDEIMEQVLAIFREEQAEHRQAVGELLLELERDPAHPQRRTLLDELFRHAHSLKGGARSAGVIVVEQIAHRVEDIFDAVRQGDLELTPAVCDPLYAAFDAIGTIMTQADTAALTRADCYPLLPVLLARIDQAALAHPADHAVPAALKPEQPIIPVSTNGHPTDLAVPATGQSTPFQQSFDQTSTVRLSTALLDNLMNETGELMTCTIRAGQQARDTQLLSELPARWRRTWRQAGPAVARLKRATPNLRPTVHHLDDRDDMPELGVVSGVLASVEQRDITTLLDALTQAHTLITDLEGRLASSAHQSTGDHSHLAAVTERLHEQVRRTRMLPLSTLFSPLRLHLREVARAAGKQVVLELDDGGAEADRQVLEQLREVLLHLLRNAVDHGIESTAVRIAQSKPEHGQITLTANVSGDHLLVTVSDDGAGLNLAAIRAQALASNIATEIDLSRMSEHEIGDLIFLPGFSTRAAVSEISGRGVGLDIVRSHVERMHGQVAVRSQAGCRFLIRVPLSLTSSHGLLLQAGSSRYIIALDAVQRIVQLQPEKVRSLEGRTVLVIDERPLPLAELAQLLGEESRAVVGHSSQVALLLGSGERQIACIVDAVLGEQDLVVQRLPAPLQQVRFVAGATILADGSVVPILDTVDVVREAIGASHSMAIAAEQTRAHQAPLIVVCDDSITTRTLEKNILEAAGYRVKLATDGREALGLLRQLASNGGCDLLLSDIDMPHMNGFELTSQVRADAQLQHLPIVLVTSLEAPADRERGIAAGADAYIVKRAFDQASLLDTISRLL